ncbi:MAG TPA: oligoendopeptidase F, partial [Syntrophomonadaceae bacterium]|nr:oligoendopeptidase F [Syntrophomonadaceae bacterium]
AMCDRVESLAVQLASCTAFIVPEILSIPEENLQAFMDENSELQVYRHFIDELLRQRPHILSPEEEKLLAMVADVSMASGNIFTMLNNADIKFPAIRDEEGREIELTKGRYGTFMESHDRRVRKDAFEALYSSYGKVINTLGATLNASIKTDIFYARARKYPSAIEASLDQDNVPLAVYDRLIESVHAYLTHMYRYMELRKRLLGLDELHMYDIYVPLVPDYKVNILYEEAKKKVLEALEPLGPEYLSQMKNGLEDGWIDVYENEGKTSGAFSWGTYDTKPYILMNYDNRLDDLFTLAHEMGHSMHSYYSNQQQPYVYSQYSIFVAEVASTVNESLLMDYLLNKSQDRQEKIYLLNHYLEEFRGTIYRQTMFAEFEKIVHEKVERGEALTPDKLNEIYVDLNRLYYGPNVIMDPQIAMEWARIPHFYSAFYVYKYATGFSSATAIKQQIISEGQPAVDRYLRFLGSGSSDYPIELLKRAGVDLTTPEPVEAALNYFGCLLDELEELTAQGAR